MPEPSIAFWLRQSTASLQAQGADAPLRIAQLLLCHALHCNALYLTLHPDEILSEQAVARAEKSLALWLFGQPLAWILGQKEFYGRSFKVNEHVLVPRPETELLVDEALARVAGTQALFADLGTGSGCIAITLCCERPGWQGVALDISPLALNTARQNALTLGATKLAFALADMSGPWVPELTAPASLDLIISNPPYISAPEMAELDSRVLAEPHEALTPCKASPDGLELICALLPRARAALKPGGLLLVEHGSSQGAACRHLAQGWASVSTGCDLAGLERFLIAVK